MLVHSWAAAALVLAGALHLVPSDAGSGMDAPNFCTPNEAAIELETNQEYFGFFTFVDDTADHYGFRLDQPAVVEINMRPAPGLAPSGKTPLQTSNLPAPNYDLALFTGTCGFLERSALPGTSPEHIQLFLEAGLYDVEVSVAPLLPAKRSASTLYCDPFCILAGYGIDIRNPPELP